MPRPSRNQKVMSDNEKELLKEGMERQREIDEEDRKAILEADSAIFAKEQQNLPQLLEQRIASLELALEEELEDIKGLKAARIHQLIGRNTNGLAGYSAKELNIVFEAYKNMIVMINKHTLYVPSMKNFCAFAGFSTITYKNYLQSPDDEKRNVMQMIEDYITDINIDASKMRRTDNATTIFELKSTHGQVEAVAPQQINFGGQVSVSEIMNRISQIKQGKVVDADFKEKD